MRPDQPEPDAAGARRDGRGDARDGAPDRDRGARPAADSAADSDAGSDSAVPASRAERMAAHAEYREAVDASDRVAADRHAWADAVPGLRAAWAEHQERYPEPARARPRTESDGSWVSGEYRQLDPEQNTEASKAHADLADEASRSILPALRRIEAADPERRLAGLDHMIKGEDRLKEKLADYLRAPGTTVREALYEVPDAVRFTFCYTADRYSNGVLADVDRLKDNGCELVKFKNLWEAEQYKGVNSQWRMAETATRFEIQFHTPQSLEAKELTHDAYERARSNLAATAEVVALEDFQRLVNSMITPPPGTDRLKDFPEKTSG